MSDNPHNPNGTDHRSAISLLVLMIALVVRFVNLALLSRAPFFPFKIGDAARYDQWGQNIAAGDWIGQGVFYQAPLYPYFLGVIYSLLGDDVMTVRKIQAVIGAASCVFLMNAVWNLFNSRRAGIVAGIVMALYVPSIFLETLLQKSVLDLFFICVIIWLVSKIHVATKARHWIALGASIGALCLTRENALALVPFFGLWALMKRQTSAPSERQLLKFEQLKPRLATCCCLVFGIALIISPVAIRNYIVGGELHITTSQLGPNFYIGNNPDANGTYQPLLAGRGNAKYEQADAVALASKKAGRDLTPAEVSDFYMAESVAYIREQPLDWAKLLGTKTLLSLNATEIIDTEDQYTYESWSPLMRGLSLVFHFGLLAPLAVVGLIRVGRRWRELWVLLAMAGLFQATMILFFVFGRYRFPIVPLLIVFASPLIAHIVVWLQKQLRSSDNSLGKRIGNFAGNAFAATITHWRSIAIATVVFAISLLPIVSTDSARAVTYNNFGVQMLLRGKLAEAESYFRDSLEITPGNALAHNNLGVVLREQNDYLSASRHFEIALELEPNLQTARRNLDRIRKS